MLCLKFLIVIIKTIRNRSGLNIKYIYIFKQERRKILMATIFGNMLAALAKVMNNGVSTFTWFGVWDETDCPDEIL